jgi:S-adenosylmethionine decarboxylase
VIHVKHSAIGSHCILELHGCPYKILDDETIVRNAIVQASRKSLSTLLHLSSHRFEPQGVTAVGLLAESHISIHTWPELGYAACDIFTCGESARPAHACDFLAATLQAASQSLQVLTRGRGLPPHETGMNPGITRKPSPQGRPRWAVS